VANPGIDAVIHVASGTPGTGKTKSEIIDSSMTGTIGIMQATIRAGIKKFIFTGSMAAMNDRESQP
jgi:nucleoside-diphosphate-sugar epimerase